MSSSVVVVPGSAIEAVRYSATAFSEPSEARVRAPGALPKGQVRSDQPPIEGERGRGIRHDDRHVRAEHVARLSRRQRARRRCELDELDRIAVGIAHHDRARRTREAGRRRHRHGLGARRDDRDAGRLRRVTTAARSRTRNFRLETPGLEQRGPVLVPIDVPVLEGLEIDLICGSVAADAPGMGRNAARNSASAGAFTNSLIVA